MVKKLVYACDYRGIELRKALVKNHDLIEAFEAEDLGIDDSSKLDYIDVSRMLAERLRNTNDLGVMICGSGQGVAIALNRFTHIRAVLARSAEESVQTRQKLNANVICLGSKYSSFEESQKIIKEFVREEFIGEKHLSCVQKLDLSQTAHINNGINVIARGIIVHNNNMLLTTATPDNPNFSQDIFFLPGGHVEYNEPVLQALKREIWEEMNLKIEESKFIGVLECSWNRNGSAYHELNIVFNIFIKGLDLSNPPIAMDHKFHKFVWKPLDQIDNIVILPESLKTIIKNYRKQNLKIDLLSQM